MKTRVTRIAGCLLAVLAGYSGYALLAVPFLEPSIELAAATETPLPPPTRRDRGFEKLFPPGAWELASPKVVETDNATLLFDDYKRLDGGRLQLNQCSLIFRLGGTGADQNQRPPLVLRAVEGAILFFEGELNIPRGEFGRLVGGQLSGEVQIYSRPTTGGDDALEINTRDVRIEQRRIWTPHQVAFRYGPSSGSGSDLSISMHPPSAAGGSKAASKLGQIKSVELRRVDKINLHLPVENLADVQPDSAGGVAGRTTSLDIKCGGSLRFDFDEYVLSLNDRVDVIRHNLEGPSDQLNCQQLLIHFQQPAESEPLAADSPPRFKLAKIVALGLPVTLRADSMDAFARGEQLEYDFQTRRIWIQDRNQVLLRNERFEVRSPELEYELAEAGRIGRLWAAGPGRATGTVGKQQRPFLASWQKEVRLQPFRGAKVLSLIDDAHVNVDGTGNVTAGELHVFLVESPRPDDPGRVTISPDRLKAVSNVRFDSPRLTGTLDEANLWFAETPRAGAATETGSAPSASPPPPAVQSWPDPSEKVRQLRVAANRLNAQLTLGKSPQVVQLAAQGDVRCEEVDPADQQGIRVAWDLFQLVHADTENAIATLVGRPARVEARGAALAGGRMTIQQGNNTAQIDGPGEMTLPHPRNPRQPWRVQWQREMHFDGQHARFAGQVAASGIQTLSGGEQVHVHAQGETVRVGLSRFVDFERTASYDDIELRDLMFDGASTLTSQTVDLSGQPRTSDRISVHNLQVDQHSGRIHGDGPGWLTSVHLGEELFREGQLATAAKGLNFLRIDFQRELAGNLHARQLEFRGDVRTVYGPVSSWDQTIQASDPSQLRQRDVVINAQRLAIADMGQSRDRFDAVELEATGNAFIRGQSFTAAGQRVSYVRSKDQLVLEGDGRNLAVLTYQKNPRATPAPLKARKIFYWPDKKQFELFDFHSLDVDNLSELRRRRQ